MEKKFAKKISKFSNNYIYCLWPEKTVSQKMFRININTLYNQWKNGKKISGTRATYINHGYNSSLYNEMMVWKERKLSQKKTKIMDQNVVYECVCVARQ